MSDQIDQIVGRKRSRVHESRSASPSAASLPYDTISLPAVHTDSSSSPSSPPSPSLSPLPSVDVIIPAYNAALTLFEAVQSVFDQSYPGEITVCVYNDSSSDSTEQILKDLHDKYHGSSTFSSPTTTTSTTAFAGKRSLVYKSGVSKTGAGAGYARNRSAELSNSQVLCLLDADDVMLPDRVSYQISSYLSIPVNEREGCIIGCKFYRLPDGSTWHYTEWANNLSAERLHLEQFRELTLLQPTWMLARARFERLGGYLEAPIPSLEDEKGDVATLSKRRVPVFGYSKSLEPEDVFKLYDVEESLTELKLCEDLRLFHAHLATPTGTNNDERPALHLVNSESPLLMYRHNPGQSQSSFTPRKLLFKLNLRAFESRVLRKMDVWKGDFAIWGAGRDGKAFMKGLAPDIAARCKCMVDIDEKKIAAKFYFNPGSGIKVRVLPFQILKGGERSVEDQAAMDLIATKAGKGKKQDPGFDSDVDYSKLPVVVCVAMYRTGGKLEANVASIGRTEGVDLWHFN